VLSVRCLILTSLRNVVAPEKLKGGQKIKNIGDGFPEKFRSHVRRMAMIFGALLAFNLVAFGAFLFVLLLIWALP
jgi:hypothetical protein